jgi:hypothetical protein
MRLSERKLRSPATLHFTSSLTRCRILTPAGRHSDLPELNRHKTCRGNQFGHENLNSGSPAGVPGRPVLSSEMGRCIVTANASTLAFHDSRSTTRAGRARVFGNLGKMNMFFQGIRPVFFLFSADLLKLGKD